MKHTFRYLLGLLGWGGLVASAIAQQQPVLSVNIDRLSVQAGPGYISDVVVTNGGREYTTPPIITVTGGEGTGANLVAQISGGSVTGVVINNPGTGYQIAPKLTFLGGGGTGAAATAVVQTPVNIYDEPNESFGPSGQFVIIQALATGTSPAAGFTYTFFVNGTSIGTSTNNTGSYVTPGRVAWTPPAPGAYFFTVTASDGTNTVTSLPIRYFATGVVITSPRSPTLVPGGSSVVIKGDATTAQGFVRQIEFFVDGQSQGVDTSAPYSIIYTPPTLPGAHQITAVATDNNGNTLALERPVTINVVSPIGAIPTVAVASPASGSALRIPDYITSSGASIPISVIANDSDGAITKVETYIDGVLVNTDQQFPYTFNWQPQSIGSYRIVALAFDDKNNVVASTPSVVTVSAPPTVTITRPTEASALPAGAPTTVTANASDSDGGVVSVQFFADNELIGEDTTAPYSVTWIPTQKADSSTAVLTALATDNFGITTLSTPINITVTGSGSGTGNNIGQPPVVTLTNPVSQARLVVGQSVTLTANASDVDGNVHSVQFFANGQSLGSDNSFPYSATWTPSSLGTYAVVAKALDNDGNATSAEVSVTVVANSAGLPQVSLLSPVASSKATVGSPVVLAASAVDSDGTVQSVDFSVNGLSVGRTTAFPYLVSWTPTAAGVYSVSAAVTDDGGNRVISAVTTVTVADAIGHLPLANVSFNNPALSATDTTTTGSTTPIQVSYGSKLLITSQAVDDDGGIAKVEFYMNGRLLATRTAAPYSVLATLDTLQDVILTAVVTDTSGNVVYALPKVIDTQPAVGIADLKVELVSPEANRTYTVGSQIVFAASHNAGNQPAPRIDFYVNGQPFHTLTAEPFSFQMGLSQPGTYDVQAVLRSGTATTVSAPTRIFVTAGVPPTIVLTDPADGTTIRLGSSINVRADAADADGTIQNVQFFVNGTLIGTDSSSPYTISYTPAGVGILRFTALATDSSGQSAVSAARTIQVTSSSTFSSEAVYVGDYLAGSETGKIALVNTGGKTGVGIAFSTTGASKSYLFQNMTVDSANRFSLASTPSIAGQFSDTAASGTFDGTRASFIAIATFAGANGSAPAGLYAGNLAGKLASTVTAIVGNDGTVYVYLADGSATDVGTGSLLSNGTFSVTLKSGGKFTGQIDPVSRFLTGGISGGPVTGSVIGAASTGGNFSDGALRNLSTRGNVGTGNSVMIAGFIVGGNTPKKVLVRAVGPTLASFGVTGVLANPDLQIFRGSTSIERNDNWGGNAAIVQAAGAVGAFALAPSSLDSAILTTLSPGAYTATVTGVNNTSGVALVEVYDVDAADPFTPQKVMNISTRGDVGTGDRILMAGFVVSGTSPKKVLVRAVGPTLSTFGVTGTLADPILRITTQSNTTIRENDNWETGNNVPLLTDAANKAGAFAFPTGSKDAAVLLTLPPGTYTAQVSGVSNTTGVALVEVYEVP